MAVSKKISELPVLVTPDAADLLPVVDVTDNVTKQITVDSIAPAASITVAGVIEIATAAETRALASGTLALTPTTLAQTFYAIRLDLDATPTVVKTTPQTQNWSIARNSTGNYTLTHNLDLTDQDNMCWQLQPDAAGTFSTVINSTKDTVVIHVANGDPPGFVDPNIDFMLLGFRFGE